MLKLWLIEVLLQLSMLGALALDETPELMPENDITVNQVGHVTAPRVKGIETDTHSCQPDVCDFLVKLGAMQNRLAAAERRVEELRSENTVQMLEIQALKHRTTFTEAELRDHSSKLDELGRGKVAFSASVGGYGHTGPYDVETTLKYKNVFTNIGNAYNPASGIFVAPVRGIYNFNFCYHAGEKNAANIALYRNNDLIATTSHKNSGGDYAQNGSNGVALQLEEGDHIYINLRGKSWVWDGPNHDTVFTGFLVSRL